MTRGTMEYGPPLITSRYCKVVYRADETGQQETAREDGSSGDTIDTGHNTPDCKDNGIYETDTCIPCGWMAVLPWMFPPQPIDADPRIRYKQHIDTNCSAITGCEIQSIGDVGDVY